MSEGGIACFADNSGRLGRLECDTKITESKTGSFTDIETDIKKF